MPGSNNNNHNSRPRRNRAEVAALSHNGAGQAAVHSDQYSIEAVGRALAPMPKNDADRPYVGVVLDAMMLTAPNGEMGLLWVISVVRPEKFKGARLAHLSKLDPVRSPQTMPAAAEELQRMGLTQEQIYENETAQALRTRVFTFNYTPRNDKRGVSEQITILGQLSRTSYTLPPSSTGGNRMLLGWFDDNPDTPVADKIRNGAERYQAKFSRTATVCLLNSTEWETLPEDKRHDLDGITLRVASYVRKFHYWIGVEDEMPGGATTSQEVKVDP